MENKKSSLDVDFIGSQDALSVSEEKALSEYFSSKKNKLNKKRSKIIKSKQEKLSTIA